jgi:hypothetical protein
MATSEGKDSAQGSQLEPHHLLQNGFSSGQRHTFASSSSSSSDAAMRSKREHLNRPKASSSSSRNTHSSTSTRAENRAAQRDVRTLPCKTKVSSQTSAILTIGTTAWIDSFEKGDDVQPTDSLLSHGQPTSPSRAHSAQHHHTPSQPHRRVSQDGYVDDFDDSEEKRPETGFFGGHKEPVKGRKWDHKRDGAPPAPKAPDWEIAPWLNMGSPWRIYIKSSMYGPSQSEDSKRVDEQFLQSQTPGYQRPWRGDLEGGDPEKLSGLLHSKKQRRTLIKRVQVGGLHSSVKGVANKI